MSSIVEGPDLRDWLTPPGVIGRAPTPSMLQWHMSEGPSNKTQDVVELLVAHIKPGDNDRRQFDEKELRELAASIAEHGLAQPIIVRPLPAGDGPRFEIVAGERRYRAHKLNGAKGIRAIIMNLDDEQAAAIMLAENVARADLNPMDEARAYQARLDRFGYTEEKLAELTGKSVGVIRARLRLLDLDPTVQDAIEKKSMWVAGAADIARLNHARQRLALNAYAKAGYMTGSQWKALVAKLTRDQDAENEHPLFDPGDPQLVAEHVAAAKREVRPGAKALAQLLRQALDEVTDRDLRVEIIEACRLYDMEVPGG